MIDTPRINVQPTPGEIQVYHNVSWAQPTTDMLEDALIRVFEDSGKIAGVTGQEPASVLITASA